METTGKYLDKLIELRALIREAVGRSKAERHVLNKNSLHVEVVPCSFGKCYECCERVNNGLAVKILGIRQVVGRKVEFTEEFYFHNHHF